MLARIIESVICSAVKLAVLRTNQQRRQAKMDEINEILSKTFQSFKLATKRKSDNPNIESDPDDFVFDECIVTKVNSISWREMDAFFAGLDAFLQVLGVSNEQGHQADIRKIFEALNSIGKRLKQLHPLEDDDLEVLKTSIYTFATAYERVFDLDSATPYMHILVVHLLADIIPSLPNRFVL
jgi:hypothetical protein